jgi:hypothetical protein
VRHHEGNSLNPRKDDFQKLMMQSSRFFQERHKTGLFVNYDLLCEEAIKKTRFLNIPQNCFKASKGWAIRFMHRMGLALWRKTTICQKNALDGSEDVIVKEDVEDKDDSDWVESMYNDSVMSDDGESDE